MKATCVYIEQYSMGCEGDRVVSIYMDLFRVPDGHLKGFPEGYKFSWIAFDPMEPGAQVLFDCQPPKGPHFHIDDDPVGTPYQWSSLKEAESFFFEKIQERFGKFTKEELR